MNERISECVLSLARGDISTVNIWTVDLLLFLGAIFIDYNVHFTFPLRIYGCYVCVCVCGHCDVPR